MIHQWSCTSSLPFVQPTPPVTDTLQPDVESPDAEGNEPSSTSVGKDPGRFPDVFKADLPPLVDEASPDTKERFVDLFLAEIRNDNTRWAGEPSIDFYGWRVGKVFPYGRSPRAPYPSTLSN